MEKKSVNLLMIVLLSLVFNGGFVIAQDDILLSVDICVIVVDNEDNIITGEEASGTIFEIVGENIAGRTLPIPDTKFELPLELNSDLLLDDGKNDAECITQELQAFQYFGYGEEIIRGEKSLWEKPRYNDEYNVPVMSARDFYEYSADDPYSDDPGLANSNGVIAFSQTRQERKIVVLNKLNRKSEEKSTASISPSNAESDRGNILSDSGGNTILWIIIIILLTLIFVAIIFFIYFNKNKIIKKNGKK